MTDSLPNILVIMSDEHGPMFSSTYGHPLVETPSMDRLASEGTTFENGYCNSPLCTPSRLSFMTGKYVSHCQGWDNSTPLDVGRITWPWLLKTKGYDTVLNGKMHMMGPKPLNGFDKQLTHDPHAANAHAVRRWDDGVKYQNNFDSNEQTPNQRWPDVLEAGPGRSQVIDHDDMVEDAAHEYIRELDRKEKPWAMVCGFISPHFPLKVPEPYFSQYYPDNTDLPNNPPGHLDNLPPSAKRLQTYTGTAGPYTDDETRKARAAYYGMISFLDDKIGRLMDTLEATGQRENTVVIHTSDHGEMAGEHGLWRKMNFYEQAARIPLQISWPGNLPEGKRVSEATSNVEFVATLLDIVGIDPTQWDMDGDSFLHYLQGTEDNLKDEVICEYLAHGTDGPRIMVRQGEWKLSYTHRDPVEFELYNLKDDPGEFENLADRQEVKEVQDRLFARAMEVWRGDPDGLSKRVRESQKERYLLREITGTGEDRLF